MEGEAVARDQVAEGCRIREGRDAAAGAESRSVNRDRRGTDPTRSTGEDVPAGVVGVEVEHFAGLRIDPVPGGERAGPDRALGRRAVEDLRGADSRDGGERLPG